ncbi:MAG: ComEC/Rec2 family competence protein [Hyphomicrobiaceae bacterium]|nr:ComEC/Rec2 family competence protein [Hyphomicrobiaceae bacterium]
MRRIVAALETAIAAEQDHLFLWVPILFGGGVALYFALSVEPTLAAVLPSAVVPAVLVILWRRGLASLIVGGVLLWLGLGLAAGKLASERAASPVIDRELRRVTVAGWVERTESRSAEEERITIRVARLEPLAAGQAPPLRVRIRVPVSKPPLEPGHAAAVVADLLPPAGPALPGAYDFARAAWFQRLGGVGYTRQQPVATEIGEPMPLTLRLWAPIERLRQSIGQRIRAALPGETGAIAAALVTGERGGISEATNAAYRDSGIFHILSISGLHMTVFAGALYFFVRLVLAFVPRLALRHQIKKWAAVVGLAGTTAYLMISGGSPPAIRSGIMIGVMFLAVLLDRPALALRNVAIAAMIVLVATPESVIDVGFQMSFAAVVALISGLEAWRDWRRAKALQGEPAPAGPVRSIAVFLSGIAVTTVIATAAVAPFAAYYFHKSTQYGLLANLVAIPICNVLVMPAALATLLAMPLGLEAGPLAAMGLGIEGMTWVAHRVATLPGAVTTLPEISTLAFGLMVGGGIWLALWHGRWRLAGLMPVMAGLALSPLRDAPDVLVAGNGALVAVRGADGRYAAIDTARSRFELGRWLEHDGDSRKPEEVGPGRAFKCDPTGCVASVRNRKVAVVRHASALGDDCRSADIVIWMGAGRPACRARLIARADLEHSGTHAIVVARDGSAAHRIETVRERRGDRPWAATVRLRGHRWSRGDDGLSTSRRAE